MQEPFLRPPRTQMEPPHSSAPGTQPTASGLGVSSERPSARDTAIDVGHPNHHWRAVHAAIDNLSSKGKQGQGSRWPDFLRPHDLHPRIQDRQSWRHKLGKALESDFAHLTILVLILVDVVATSVDIVLTLHTKANDVKECRLLLEECSQPTPWEPHSTEHEPLFFTSTGILGLLCLNLLLLLVAFGFNFFRHPGYVLDLAIIPTALFLEIFLDSEVLALLVILNLWRLIRVAHGVFTVTDDAIEEEVEQLKRSVEVLQRQSDKSKEDLETSKARIERLENLQQGASIDR
ncbi:hypothetical protein KFL_000510320 [Klebsormidium nitens]|uniref:Hydrogen voltage-gated channel 1 n=1 Tax=Klebsormidium nitens TaxID=105231 RepID=A0A1Y1HTJ8_KLENI|nr:hypothetical protein KFL_000510320 [Klebsormidium nitens]|eukprot:GAQ80331.1 hypothetical protein KFL_000510320 [Klebsormidium nitens]